jgi:hypothetical protein
MDYLTSNPDRHGHNIMLNPDGSPLAIDHSRAFWEDRKHAIGEENEGELGDDKEFKSRLTSDPEYQHIFTPDWEKHQTNSDAAALGTVDRGTIDWWNDNKDAILQKFKEHVAMLPDPKMRQKVLNSFASRHARVERLLREHINPSRHVGSKGVVSGYEKTAPSQTYSEGIKTLRD